MELGQSFSPEKGACVHLLEVFIWGGQPKGCQQRGGRKRASPQIPFHFAPSEHLFTLAPSMRLWSLTAWVFWHEIPYHSQISYAGQWMAHKELYVCDHWTQVECHRSPDGSKECNGQRFPMDPATLTSCYQPHFPSQHLGPCWPWSWTTG